MGCFMEGWGLHGERPPLWHISLLPLLPLPYPLSLQAAFPITTAFFLPSWQVESWEMPHGAPLPMAHPSPWRTPPQGWGFISHHWSSHGAVLPVPGLAAGQL